MTFNLSADTIHKILTLVTTIALGVIGAVHVRKSQVRKENAEADVAEEEIVNEKIKRAKLLKGMTEEPNVTQICEEYRNLIGALRERVDILEDSVKKLQEENAQLRKELDLEKKKNTNLLAKLDSFSELEKALKKMDDSRHDIPAIKGS